MRTHEATRPHHMPLFFNKAQGPFKTKVNCSMYCMHPFTKSLVQVFSKSLKFWNLPIVLCPFTDWIKWISNTHKKFYPPSLVWFLLSKSMSKCCIPHYPFPPCLCTCQGVVTSPCTWRYSNDASSGDATSELTFEKKPRIWQRTGSLPTCHHLLHLRKKTKRW
jgi:hypothetical protein